MSFDTLQDKIRAMKNPTVAGLDARIEYVPAHIRKAAFEEYGVGIKGACEAIWQFNVGLIDALCDIVPAVKPQSAYYENLGWQGMEMLERTIQYAKSKGLFVIADIKRGDIGSTAQWYAKEAFDRYGADAVTVNPYMGYDAVQPFLEYADKGVIILCRTSNPHSGDLQNLIADGKPLYVHVAELVRDRWNGNGNAALVVGATYPEELRELRRLCPELPFLVPGVGAQGGDVEKVVKFGCRADGAGIIVNSSRGIIYASNGPDFAEAAGRAAARLRDEINVCRRGC